MKNTLINKLAVETIAKALGELNTQAVFVGGAVVSLYIDDPSADDVRPTKDVDISLHIATFSELEKIRLLLTEKGFFQTSEDNVICRFRFQDIKVDVMSTKPVGWAPANRWFESGFHHLQIVQLNDVEVKILRLPWFLAAKFDAFYSRGFKDPRTSHDFEDIVYLLNYTTKLEKLILEADVEVQSFLKEAFNMILKNQAIQEAVMGNLYYEDQIKRFDKIIQTLKKIVQILR
jgi:predicted nucleotidyltransferase